LSQLTLHNNILNRRKAARNAAHATALDTVFGRAVRTGVSCSIVALSLALFASGASAQTSPSQAELSDEGPQTVAADPGTISGRITNAADGTALADVEVSVDGTRYTAESEADGTYRIIGVAPGEHTVSFRRPGFVERQRTVRVSETQGAIANLEIAQISGADADVIVVTGNALSTQRSTSAPVSIITAEDIERKQIRNMTDLLRGEFAGVFALNSGLNDWTTQVITRGETSWNYGTSDLNGDYMKIFIDGVELARPTLLSTLDPQTIERIEIVRGPQAGTMYGAEGATGLMKIVTKKGSNDGRLRVDAKASVGVMDSDYTPDGVTPYVHDHSVQLSGGDDDLGYRLGASYQSIGEWAQRYDSESLAFSGGIRARRGPFTASLSAFHNTRELYTANFSYSCTLPNRADTASCLRYREPGDKERGLHYPMTETLVALTLNYEAAPNWQHTVTLGQDKQSFGYEGGYSETRNYYQNTDYTRRTLRYSTVYDLDISSDFDLKMTAGADAVFYKDREFSINSFTYVDGKPDLSTAQFVDNHADSWDNFGYFGIAELGFRNQAYLTLAGRVDNGIRFVGDSETSQFQPRVGLAYVFDEGPATLKLRGQWGESVRPPIDERAINGGYGFNVYYLPNPDVGPERKVGWDAGFDLTWAGIGTLSATRFDEEGRDLIMPVDLRPRVAQYQNFGVVTNKGWEFEGNASFGPLSLRGNLTFIDNRIKELSNFYQDEEDPLYQEGDRRLSVPKFIAGVTATVSVLGGSVSANAFWLGPRRQLDGAARTRAQYGLEPDRPTTRDYYVDVPTLWRLNLRGEMPVNDWLSVFGQVDNVLKDQDSDRSTTTIAPGRVVLIGARTSF